MWSNEVTTGVYYCHQRHVRLFGKTYDLSKNDELEPHDDDL